MKVIPKLLHQSQLFRLKFDEVKYLNLEMNTIKELVKKSIDKNEPVWFGSDVGKYLHSKSNILDEKVFNMEEYLDITKVKTQIIPNINA